MTLIPSKPLSTRFRILAYLEDNFGRAVGYEELMRVAYGEHPPVCGTDALAPLLSKLRGDISPENEIVAKDRTATLQQRGQTPPAPKLKMLAFLERCFGRPVGYDVLLAAIYGDAQPSGRDSIISYMACQLRKTIKPEHEIIMKRRTAMLRSRLPACAATTAAQARSAVIRSRFYGNLQPRAGR